MELTGLNWRKSSKSANAVNCVEVADLPGGGFAIRDSKDPEGPTLVVSRGEFAAFVESIKAGEFDG